MAMLIYDPAMEKRLRAKLDAERPEGGYEVWEGDVVVSPVANFDHQDLSTLFTVACWSVTDRPAGDHVQAPCNVSDRHRGWKRNYRNPDVSVYLRTNPAVNHGTHWQGGPDLAVEILSPGEPPYAKLPFYAAVGTRELLIVFRDPWRLELFRPAAGAMQQVVAAGVDDPAVSSGVLPLTFALKAGAARPVVSVSHAADGRVWEA